MEKEFHEIIDLISKYKGLTKKTSERLVVDLINNNSKLDEMVKHLKEIKSNFKVCKECFYIALNNDLCDICLDDSRDSNIICVVGTTMDAMNIEKHKKYKGKYAVLGGEINLGKNIKPEDLKINELFERVNPKTELILALNATFEGEVTANYLSKIANLKKIKTTRIAKGIPSGGMLDYMDESTLEYALNNRKEITVK
ncbi:recombination mediator RecR [Williamsoniiplasma luminosum]|uniref:Recombination protein RecR n=1 Tax=Williamsoniiplasma luminosum TaxID=214888 RepID=A0A2S0NKM1_9MOLU|nr:recombination mediator RecR [Williamsoniiplasma luminosum]AVP49552.1 MAG: recombination protein RecR [Williamsoniiplasma luminosum]